MSWDGHKRATATIAGWHGGRLPVGADKGATMDDRDIARQTAETRAARAATRLRGVTAREADVRLAEAVADALHTAMVGAGRGATMADPEDGAQQAGATHPDAYGRLLRESTRLREERAALRAAVARLAGELTQADSYIGKMAETFAGVTAERDAARAALAGLLTDVEHLAQANHDTHHPKPGDAAEWRECNRGICPGIRRAVARARAATGGASDALGCPESGGKGRA